MSSIRCVLAAAATLLSLSSFASSAADALFIDGFDPGIGFVTYRLPDRADNVACSGAANGSAQINRVYIGQTHMLELSHPFFELAANRPALLKVNVIGSGTAPQVSVTATLGARTLGPLCIRGPQMLPASVDRATQLRSNSFTVTLPSAWIEPGLSLTIKAGAAQRVLDAASLKVGAEPEMNLIAQDALLFGSMTPTPYRAHWIDYLSTLSLSALKVTELVPLVSDRLPIGVRGDGRSPSGQPMAQPATIATRNPSCNEAEAAAGTCTTYSGYAVLNGVRAVVGAVMRANGLERIAQTYGALGADNAVGGGLAGGDVGAGDDYGLIFNHENGHSADMPHWGGSWYGRADADSTQKHPYSGEYGTSADPVGGGFGNSWGYHYPSDRFVAPICAATGKERQEPMQRDGDSCVLSGGTYDYFSDYSAMFMFRYFSGASANYSGVVAYPRDPRGNAAATPFAFPGKDGKVVISQPNSAHPTLAQWDDSLHEYVAINEQSIGMNLLKHAYPNRYNVPVTTFWGSFSIATPAATMIGVPHHYVGYLRKTWDPTDAVDFADIKSWISGDAFWWGADLVLRVDYADGSRRQAVIKGSVRAVDPNDGASYSVWAVNFPGDQAATRVRLYYRPMQVRYPGNDTPENINATGNPTTAANYLSSAPVVADWTP